MSENILYHGSKEIIRFFYQPRDYIRECYLEGEILES